MKICVCVKRVPMVGGTITLTPDGLGVDTSMSGFTVSPHEECAVEEAVQIVEREAGVAGVAGAAGVASGIGRAGAAGAAGVAGGVTVLTLGPPEAAQQLRDMLALGASRAVLLRTDGSEWGPVATAAAIADAVRGAGFDLLLFGNEAADSGGYQVPVRVAHALGVPCVTGVKRLEVLAEVGGGAVLIAASRELRGGTELFELALPAVVSVKEGINLPRYPSLPGRLRAKRATIEEVEPRQVPDRLRTERLRVPADRAKRAQVLGEGTDAVPALVRLLDELGVLG